MPGPPVGHKVTGPVPSDTWIAVCLALLLAALLRWQRRGRSFPRVSPVAGMLAACGLVSYLKSVAPYLSSLGAAGLVGFVAVIVTLEMGIGGHIGCAPCVREFPGLSGCAEEYSKQFGLLIPAPLTL